MSDELRCDCDPDARPVVREADKLKEGRFGIRRYVQCPECRKCGMLADSWLGAIWQWNHLERTVE